MRLDLNSLQVDSFATATGGDAGVNSDFPSVDPTWCWGCEGTSVPSCEINMCEVADIPPTYLEPCTLRNLTCVGCA